MAFNYVIASAADVDRANVTVASWNRGRKNLLKAATEFFDSIKSDLPQQISSGSMGYFTLDETGAKVKVNHFVSSRIPRDNLFHDELSHSEIENWREALKEILINQETWETSWQRHLVMFSAFGFGSAGQDSSASYSAAAMTAMAESLQCLACATRQVLNTNIDADIFSSVVMGQHPQTAAIRRFSHIDDSLYGDGYPSLKHFYEMTDGGAEWVESAARIANTLKQHYLSGGNYNFYRQDQYSSFKGNYENIRKRIKTSRNSGKLIQKIFRTAGMAADKWNPADIIAVKTSFESQKDYDLNSGQGLELAKNIQDIISKDANGKDNVKTYNDLAKLYDYNIWIDKQFESGNIIPISLKKAGASVKHTVIRNKDVGKLDEYREMEVTIDRFNYNLNNEKCQIYFTIAGDSSMFLDARGFEESGKIADIQIQLQQQGSTANHGKVTLPVTELIAKLSRGRQHFNTLAQKRRRIFGRSFPLTFMGYRDIQSLCSTEGMLLTNIGNICQYISEISGGTHTPAAVRAEIDRRAGNALLQKQKYIKNKIQSYEVGFMLDKSPIQEEIKENILKSMYLYASSRGFFIFENAKVTSFLQSSTYVKVGG